MNLLNVRCTFWNPSIQQNRQVRKMRKTRASLNLSMLFAFSKKWSNLFLIEKKCWIQYSNPHCPLENHSLNLSLYTARPIWQHSKMIESLGKVTMLFGNKVSFWWTDPWCMSKRERREVLRELSCFQIIMSVLVNDWCLASAGQMFVPTWRKTSKMDHFLVHDRLKLKLLSMLRWFS